MGEYILKMQGITKSFPGVKALDNVSLDVKKGEVVALLGENGAGKSTLIKVMTGIYQPDNGEIEIFGEKTRFHNPADALKKGLSVIHQELAYMNDLSAAENIFVGRLPHSNFGWVNWKAMAEKSREVFRRMNVVIDPGAIMSSLSTAEKQLVEIAKAISWDAKILVMDEPTAALGVEDTEKLLKLVREMVSGSELSVVYISHRLNELFTVADRVVVLRDGQHVSTKNISDTNEQELISLMVGRDIEHFYSKTSSHAGEIVLEVKSISTDFLKDVTFDVHKGEIFGLFGLLGAGCMEIAEALFGVDRLSSGEIAIDGKTKKISSPLVALENGIAYLPSERKTDGLVLSMDVQNNMILATLKEYTQLLGWVNTKKVVSKCGEWVKKLTIRTPSLATNIESLSGGNQQKVALAKWLAKNPKVIILDGPTRGIDVGAKRDIYVVMQEMCSLGIGVIMISPEMPELIAMCDRIAVVSGGRIKVILNNKGLTQETIISYAI
jgi:ribose transport system ATP-binding protein